MHFTKMNGAGNDFILLDAIAAPFDEAAAPALARALCDRRRSIGADGLMLVTRAEGDADYRMRFYNSDGSLGEMCGNGARCICRYGFEHGYAGEHPARGDDGGTRDRLAASRTISTASGSTRPLSSSCRSRWTVDGRDIPMQLRRAGQTLASRIWRWRRRTLAAAGRSRAPAARPEAPVPSGAAEGRERQLLSS